MSAALQAERASALPRVGAHLVHSASTSPLSVRPPFAEPWTRSLLGPQKCVDRVTQEANTTPQANHTQAPRLLVGEVIDRSRAHAEPLGDLLRREEFWPGRPGSGLPRLLRRYYAVRFGHGYLPR